VELIKAQFIFYVEYAQHATRERESEPANIHERVCLVSRQVPARHFQVMTYHNIIVGCEVSLFRKSEWPAGTDNVEGKTDVGYQFSLPG
jgi:hypothetical protein